MSLTAEKVAEQWKISRRRRTRSAAVHQRAVAAMRPHFPAAEMTAFDVIERSPSLADSSVTIKIRTVNLTKAPARHQP